jgi:hypothetical protein
MKLQGIRVLKRAQESISVDSPREGFYGFGHCKNNDWNDIKKELVV